jgi:branched-chain amino acid transport system permease protein
MRESYLISISKKISAVQLLAILFFGLSCVFAIIAIVASDVFFLRLATEAMIFGGLALSVDLLLGITGLLPLGQALFFGFGAYASALILKNWTTSIWIVLLISTLFSALMGGLAGLIAIRSKGVYFALISFGLAQVVSKVVFNSRDLGASDGIIGVPNAEILPGLTSGDPAVFFSFTILFILFLYAGLNYLLATPYGRQLIAIKTNEHRVAFLGFNTWRYKLSAFVLSASIAGVSGALYPMLRGFVSPELMFFQVSGNAIINVIVGGTGTLIGPLYGSALLTGIRSVVGSFTPHHQLVIGVLFMAVVILLPRGIIGYLAPLLDSWRSRKRNGKIQEADHG